MPALPPITTTVCPRSSGSRWMGEGLVTVLIVPAIRLIYFSLRCQQSESYALEIVVRREETDML
jgi:hypothetical protein